MSSPCYVLNVQRDRLSLNKCCDFFCINRTKNRPTFVELFRTFKHAPKISDDIKLASKTDDDLNRDLRTPETEREPKDVKETSRKQLKKTIRDTVKELKQEAVLTVPNVLTTARMAMAPVLAYLVLHEAYTMACIVFVIAGISDLLDGFIARTFPNQTSALGSFIDPLADKLLACTLFVTLTIVDLIPVALTVLVIARDVCLMAGGFYVRYISLPSPRTLKQYFDLTNPSARLQPTAVSKANTAVQLSLVAVTLGAPVFGYVEHPALHALWYLTAATTVVSGVGYIFAKDTFKLLKESRLKKP